MRFLLPMTPPETGGLYKPEPKDWAGITNPIKLLIDYVAGFGELAVIAATVVFAIAVLAAIFGHRTRIGAMAAAIVAGAVLLANPDDLGNIFMGNTTA